MSLGLLGAYVSDSDSEDDSESQEANLSKKSSRDKGKGAKVDLKPSIDDDDDGILDNPFVTSGGRSSGHGLLPKPSFMQQAERIQGYKFDNDSSVFSNPFREKEDRKTAILEQHVNMTQKQEDMKMINGKKVCWMYRKGRCRHGHKCSFAHDTDVKVTEGEEKEDQDAAVSQGSGKPRVHQFGQPTLEESDIAQEEAPVHHKKRPGLSQDLVPNKKAMQFHNRVYNKS